MTFEDIQKAACGKAEMTPFPTPPDLQCYVSLRAVRIAWEAGQITDKRAIVEKQDVHRTYQENAQRYQTYIDVYRTYNRRCLKAESMVKTILDSLKETEPDYKALLGMAMNCIGLLCNEDCTPRVAKELLARTAGDYVDINVEEMEEKQL